jgi:hypothetical protein
MNVEYAIHIWREGKHFIAQGSPFDVDALEWLAAMCFDVPNKGEQMVRYYGYYSPALISGISRGKRKKQNQDVLDTLYAGTE